MCVHIGPMALATLVAWKDQILQSNWKNHQLGSSSIFPWISKQTSHFEHVHIGKEIKALILITQWPWANDYPLYCGSMRATTTHDVYRIIINYF